MTFFSNKKSKKPRESCAKCQVIQWGSQKININKEVTSRIAGAILVGGNKRLPDFHAPQRMPAPPPKKDDLRRNQTLN